MSQEEDDNEEDQGEEEGDMENSGLEESGEHQFSNEVVLNLEEVSYLANLYFSYGTYDNRILIFP
jgi:hypothetical protein